MKPAPRPKLEISQSQNLKLLLNNPLNYIMIPKHKSLSQQEDLLTGNRPMQHKLPLMRNFTSHPKLYQQNMGLAALQRSKSLINQKPLKIITNLGNAAG